MASAVAIVVAGGAGSRFGGSTPKQFLSLLGKPLLAHTLERFTSSPSIERTVLVLPRDGFAEAERTMAAHVGGSAVEIAPGGATRQDSVWEGLQRIRSENPGFVAVHDGARPLVSPELIERVLAAARDSGGALAALAVVETLKEVSESGMVRRTVDRRRYYRAQTPQCFRHAVLRRAFEKAREEGFVGTDESQLVERLDVPVVVVEGSERNIKVTTSEDWERAEFYLRQGG